jgi:hypothetical protein
MPLYNVVCATAADTVHASRRKRMYPPFAIPGNYHILGGVYLGRAERRLPAA